MSRYASDHKQQTRAQLVETARYEFRRHGFDRCSIAKLMDSAGLTHGGFYAHFQSKEALVEEVLSIDAGLVDAMRAVPANASKPRVVAELLQRYLDPARREGLVDCPLVAHAADAMRGGEARRELYTAQVSGLIDAVKHLSPSRADADDEATLTTVLAVGAAILSAASSDAELADRISKVASAEIERRLTGPPDPRKCDDG